MQPMKITFREVVLYHFQNLSDESVGDGLRREYEDAVDRLMNWLFHEFTQHHGDDEVLFMDADGKPKKTTFGEAFIEVMHRGWGENWTDARKVRRIQHKEWLLSLLLSKHGIDLKSQVQTSTEDIDPSIFDDMMVKPEADDNGDDDGLPSVHSPDWED